MLSPHSMYSRKLTFHCSVLLVAQEGLGTSSGNRVLKVPGLVLLGILELSDLPLLASDFVIFKGSGFLHQEPSCLPTQHLRRPQSLRP